MSKIIKAYDDSIVSSINRIGAAVSDVVDNIQASYGPLGECTRFELTVILNELVLNAVKHGNKEDEGKRVKIKAGITNSGFACLIVEDEGCGYDYDCLCKSKAYYTGDNDICNVMESGRGILIVKKLCDRVKVNDRGNKIVVLIKLKND
ncbi:MAG: ATP-binding protein [Ruminiclostridium sp.]|nr:ATP-binding protein [Ruminiclostridium sp.]